ncbi:hypothetical protein CDD82_3113 [Ophiocordyceps australis]|uniref:C2H2-type domain-containing protein n=1 Tax=Ophiocordyceps australis TaxID=1399860 RepID=A0A2C5YJP7_9HYPO|nr:hypothetical protein CDD82_3113 [Ophiocordyceps australis]
MASHCPSSIVAASAAPAASCSASSSGASARGLQPVSLASHLATRHHMSHGATAGTVVAVVVVSILVAFCLYPVVVSSLKRRRRRHGQPRDAETAMTLPSSHHQPANPRRLSSLDSFKQQDDLSRGHGDPAAYREASWTGPIANAVYTAHDDASPRPASQSSSTPAPLPFYYGEYMPVSEVIDNRSGVLQGTSADYYSPSVPSEAFGMMPASPDLHATYAASPGSRSLHRSLRYNVRHMFSRKALGDNHPRGLDSAAMAASLGGLEPQSPTALQSLHPTQLHQVSPSRGLTEPSLHQLPAMPPASYTGLPTNTPLLPNQLSTSSTTLSQSLKRTQTGPKRTPLLPPPHPAPGTVNPMDVMPASTNSERWHQTEYQLSTSSFALPQHGPDCPSPGSHHAPTQPQLNDAQPPSVMQNADAVDDDEPSVHKPAPSTNHLTSSVDPESSRHPSYPSDQSTPLPGPGSTNTSAHNTPSTQIDSLSPDSIDSSDFRHSTSPQPGPSSLTSASVFRCKEPGCNQSFGAPHKLKHHTRYHRREHKCTFPDCGKGFGTRTHLQRHINDRHDKKKLFHCTVQGCEYSKTGGKAFPRKDNWKRHMTKIHNLEQSQLPEPVEVDQVMSGT